MQTQSVFRESLLEHREHFLRILFVLETEQKSSRPGEFHPQALTDPDMNVSAHPALIVQPPLDAAIASEQRARDRARQPCDQCPARRGRRFKRLYFAMAQHARRRSR